MIFLNINIAIAILYLVLHIFTVIDLAYEWKQLHPDLKVPKLNWAARILSFIKIIINAIIPLFNLALCWVYLFKGEELKKRAIDKIYVECIAKEKKDVTHLSETSDR